MRFFNITIPLVLLKNWFYILSTFFLVSIILLPISVLTYLKFYESLIPETLPKIPFVFDNLNSTHSSGFIDLLSHTKKHGQFDPLLDYEIDVNLALVCNDELSSVIDKIQYEIRMFGVEPNLEETKFKHSILLNCNERNVYHSNNIFIPYTWRENVPPLMINWSRDLRLVIDRLVVPGWKLNNEVEKLLVLLRFDAKTNLHDDDYTYISFQTHFTGFRWYLIKYYWTSLAAGTLVFWGISSIVCIITSYALLWV